MSTCLSLLGLTPILGIENVNALREVAKLQTLPYKFPFSQYSFPADINFIALTEGKKSLFLDVSSSSLYLFLLVQIQNVYSQPSLSLFGLMPRQAYTMGETP